MNIKYSFVVLNWNGYDNTVQCLESLSLIERNDFEVILVENGSVDGSKDKLPNLLDQFNFKNVLVDLPKNTGFTGGNIEALKYAKGTIICPLNNDAVVSRDILDKADEAFRSDKRIAVVGGKAFHWDDNNPVFSESNTFYTYQTVNTRTAEVTTESEDTGSKIKDVNNVSGSCCFIKRSAINKFGYFDKRFFAYYEETDLFARFKRGGLRVVYSPELKIWHKLGASSSSDFMMRQCLRNQFMFAFNNFDTASLLRFSVWYAIRGLKALVAVVLRRNLVDTKRTVSVFIWNLLRLPKSIIYRRRYFKNELVVDTRSYKDIIDDENNSSISLVLDLTSEEINDNKLLISHLCSLFGESLMIVNSGDRSNLDDSIVCRKVFINENNSDYRSRIGLISASNSRCILVRSLSAMKGVGKPLYEDIVQIARESKDVNCIDKKRLQHHIDGGMHVNTEDELYDFKEDLFLFSNDSTGESLFVIIPRKVSKLFRSLLKLCYILPMRAGRKIHRDGIAESFKRIVYYSKMLLKFRFATVIRNIKENQEQEDRSRKISEDSSIKHSLTETSDMAVFINCRDTVSALKKLIKKCKYFGLKRIYLLDNNSSYPPLLRLFETSYSSLTVQPIMLGENIGHTAPWDSLAVHLLSSGQNFILSDPDVVPLDSCPQDTVAVLGSILSRHPRYKKIGLSLKIDDLPDNYAMKDKVIAWESHFWDKEVEHNVYDAGVDTTFALYRPCTDYFTEPSLRVGGKFGARHMPWYQNSAELSKEELYYKSHAKSSVNTWNKDDLPDHFKEVFEMHV